MRRVLIVDDHRNTRESLALSFPQYGCHADAVATAEEALARLQRSTYDWVVSDVCMPGITGVELAKILHDQFPHVRTILITAYELTPEDAATMQALGILLLLKPVTAELLAMHCGATQLESTSHGRRRAERTV